MTTAHHEAGHAVIAWLYGVPIRSVSIRPTEEHLGITRYEDSEVSDVDFAAILCAGEIAGKVVSGKEPRFNWLADRGGEADADKARWFCDQTPDPLASRRTAEIKASVHVRHRWAAVCAIAHELERHTLVWGDDVDRLCRDAGARNRADLRSKPFDPDHAYVDLSDGRQVTMRQWADVLALHAFNERRARSALEKGAGK